MSEVTHQPKRRTGRPALLLAATVSMSLAASACNLTSRSASGSARSVTLSAGASPAPATTVPVPPTTIPAPATTSATPATTTPVTTPTPATTPTTSPAPASPHFDTPQEAMTYLATAWNAGDMTEVDHVSTPAGRAALTAMGSQADNLELRSCVARQGMGDYLCFFLHGNDSTGPGSTLMFVVGPAITPGWYLTVIMAGRCD